MKGHIFTNMATQLDLHGQSVLSVLQKPNVTWLTLVLTSNMGAKQVW